MKRWEELPSDMRCDEIRPYYDRLMQRRLSLFWKRVFDVIAAAVLLVLLSPAFAVLAVAIKLESPGPVFFRQVRVTQCEKRFRIHKFRTMCAGADRKGALVTSAGDSRVTRVGRLIRKVRLDEIPQLIDVLAGNMTFVGVRPEVERYVEVYKPEWRATFLLPAGITSRASVFFKDEDRLLAAAEDADRAYIETVLPAKMAWNLKGLMSFSFWDDIKVLFLTFVSVIGLPVARNSQPPEVQ